MLLALGIGVPITVALLVATSACLNGVAQGRVGSLARARERLARDDLRFVPAPDEGVLASDARYALVPSRDGAQLGLVSAQGADFTTRTLPPARVARLERAGDRALTLRLDEPGWPSMGLTFADEGARDHWFAVLERLGRGADDGLANT